jgi:hypothetical protein
VPDIDAEDETTWPEDLPTLPEEGLATLTLARQTNDRAAGPDGPEILAAIPVVRTSESLGTVSTPMPPSR